MAAVGGVSHLSEALLARGDVGREEPAGCATGHARVDRERSERENGGGAGSLERLGSDPLDARTRRRIHAQSSREVPHRGGFAAHLDLDSASRVAHAPDKGELARQTPDEGAETDTLHDTVHRDACRHSPAGGSTSDHRIDR